ncbi:lysophospholipid acyltransferase family protein [Frigidibacter sp. ROC022]|uniref:lysophospholipid acyltransferase family protein n=1 Tax=Frigidibacter sp. ROC022 TaxID=2971796 RepID=UPI00215B081B|nr:1-acyl-sn-glycerol-3-phosphate acyltransferase [Frigidibacter sp. ROC022]MCR8724901.1 1-acyl-sn-glycerol-3-phosphate acyltransferase [Frigidibacter sp. ROC022]
MAHALQWLRSLIFIVLMYLGMLVMGLAYLPFAIASRRYAYKATHAYTRYVRWLATHLVGLRSEIRGEVPQDEVVVAAKHQSFFDILMIFSVLPKPKFIMKSELRWAPILGFYALRIGCVPVNRGKRAQAISKMKAAVRAGQAEPGQLVIYPQGTRVAPGVKAPYKVGAGILYDQLGQDCVPVAANVGLFWPKRGIYRKPGVAVVEFLPRIPAGLSVAEVTKRLEEVIETHSDRLMAEAGHGNGSREG